MPAVVERRPAAMLVEQGCARDALAGAAQASSCGWPATLPRQPCSPDTERTVWAALCGMSKFVSIFVAQKLRFGARRDSRTDIGFHFVERGAQK